MFSRRFSRPTEHSPLWAARAAREASGAPVLDLTRTNPTAAGIAYPADLPSLLARDSVLRYDPSPRGSRSAREAVAAYLGGADPDHILLTASTSEAYGFLFKLLCDPGDEVLIPTPTYPLFDALAELDHVSLVRYPLRYGDRRDEGRGRQDEGRGLRGDGAGAGSGWRADSAFLRRIVSTRTRALILVTPNNPTGHAADPAEIAVYLELAREHGLALIVDEVFSEYLLAGGRTRPVVSDGPLVFTLNGLSKLAGLPQLKLGWIHAQGDPAAVRAALEHLEWIADAYLSVNTPVQEACADLLARAPALRAPILTRLRANLSTARRLLPEGSASPGGAPARLRALVPEAGWSLVLAADLPPSPGSARGDAPDEDAFALGLLERGVYVHPGHLFGFEEEEGRLHLVVSLLGPEAEFAEGLRRIAAYVEELHA